MKRKMIKAIVRGLLLASLVGLFGSFNAFAKDSGIKPYELPESSINYIETNVGIQKECKGVVLLDLPHHDTELDIGASYGTITERDISESISLKVKNILEANGVTVILMREPNEVISIADRVAKANSLEGYDYYISLHCNSSEASNVTGGVEGYSVGAWTLTNDILKGLCNEFGVFNRGLYYSEYYNCNIKQKNTLIELGFLNSNTDRNNLVNRQDDYARIIADAILKNL